MGLPFPSPGDLPNPGIKPGSPVLFDLRPNYRGGNEDNGDLFQKVPCRQCPQPCSRPPPSHASTRDSWTLTGKLGSKFSKPGFNGTRTVKFQIFKLDLEKPEEPEIKLPTSVRSSKKQENTRKTYTSALLTTPKPLCGSQQNVGNSSRDGNNRPPDLSLEKFVCRSGSNS